MPIAPTLEEIVSPGKIFYVENLSNYLLHFRPSQMPIHPSNLLTWFFPPIKSGSYMTSFYHRSMHRRCMNTSQNASKSFTKTIFKCSEPRSLKGGPRPTGPPTRALPGPAGDLKLSPDPLRNFVPRTPNPGSVPGSYIYFCNRWVNVRPTRCVCDNMLF